MDLSDSHNWPVITSSRRNQNSHHWQWQAPCSCTSLGRRPVARELAAKAWNLGLTCLLLRCGMYTKQHWKANLCHAGALAVGFAGQHSALDGGGGHDREFPHVRQDIQRRLGGCGDAVRSRQPCACNMRFMECMKPCCSETGHPAAADFLTRLSIRAF